MKKLRILIIVFISIFTIALPMTVLAKHYWTAEEVRAMRNGTEHLISVYVTDTGDRYHTEVCHYLRSSKNKTTLFSAVSDGYTPCKVCEPFPIPDDYYNFQKLETRGEIETAVYVLNSEYHRRMCPQVAEERTKYTLINAYNEKLSSCRYCNPPELTYAQIKEYEESQKTWLEKNWPLVAIFGFLFSVITIFYAIIIYDFKRQHSQNK